MVKLFDMVEERKDEVIEKVRDVVNEIKEVSLSENIEEKKNDVPISLPKEILDEANRRIANGETNFTLGGTNNKLFENIKNIISNEKIEKKVYFSKKGKINIVMGKFELTPSKLALFNKRRFYEVYKKELEDALFTENGSNEKVIAMIYLYGKIAKGMYPINVVFNGFKRLESDIMKVLNDFFNSNEHVLRSLYGMFNNELRKEDKEEKKDLKEVE